MEKPSISRTINVGHFPTMSDVTVAKTTSFDDELKSINANLIKSFINEGTLLAAIEQNGYSSYEKILFVSFRDGLCRILLLGSCPACSSLFMRNICLIRFTRECVSPILMNHFSDVKKINPVLSFDNDITGIITSIGGHVSYPVHVSKPDYFHEKKRFLLDFHPFVDTCCKIMFFEKEKMEKKKLENIDYNSKNTSFDDIYDRYKICWLLDESTAVVNKKGELLEGVSCILKNRDSLPDFMKLGMKNVNNRRIPVIATSNKKMFEDSVYKALCYPH